MPSSESAAQPTLPPIDVGWRENAALDALDRAEVDSAVLTSLTNIRWLTGFAGSNATVVIDADGIVLYTDSRYAERAPVELAAGGSGAEIVIARSELGDRITDRLAGRSRVALEADHITWAMQRTIVDTWLPDADVVATWELIDELRAVKDDAELARIEAAAGHVDRALAQVRPLLAEGITERGFAAALDAAIRADGADDLGFDTIVASGPNGAIPHHAPGDRRIDAGDLVIVDVGAKVDGYRSDMTRTFSIGPMAAEQAKIYDVVIAAQQAGVEAMTVGASTADVDRAARSVIEQAGWGDEFVHGTGHGIGLDIHELPRVAQNATERYRDGTVATVEPGVYRSGIGGVRIEDTCVATSEGARRLTGFAKDPEI